MYSTECWNFHLEKPIFEVVHKKRGRICREELDFYPLFQELIQSWINQKVSSYFFSEANSCFLTHQPLSASTSSIIFWYLLYDQSMTCDVRPQVAEVRCAVASCDVHAEPILVLIAMCVCGAFSGLWNATTISHIFWQKWKNWQFNLLSFGVSYDFVAQKWRILAIFHKKNLFLRNYLEGIGI